jgi:hypothetical protein
MTKSNQLAWQAGIVVWALLNFLAPILFIVSAGVIIWMFVTRHRYLRFFAYVLGVAFVLGIVDSIVGTITHLL